DGWDCTTLDLRGHGDSDWTPDGDYRLARFVADIRHVVSQTPDRPVIVGASLGGLTALLLEGHHRVARALVLVDIVPRPRPDGRRRIHEFMARHLDGFASLEEVADAVAAYNRRPRRRNPDGLRKNVRQHADGRWYWHWDPALMRLASGALLPDPDEVLRAARRIDVPVLLIRGDAPTSSTTTGRPNCWRSSRRRGSSRWRRRGTWSPGTTTTSSSTRSAPSSPSCATDRQGRRPGTVGPRPPRPRGRAPGTGPRPRAAWSAAHGICGTHPAGRAGSTAPRRGLLRPLRSRRGLRLVAGRRGLPAPRAASGAGCGGRHHGRHGDLDQPGLFQVPFGAVAAGCRGRALHGAPLPGGPAHRGRTAGGPGPARAGAVGHHPHRGAAGPGAGRGRLAARGGPTRPVDRGAGRPSGAHPAAHHH